MIPGNLIYDFSNNRNHGTLNGSLVWVEGLNGPMLDFEAGDTADYVSFPLNSSLDLTTGCTLAAWVKMETVQVTPNQGIIAKAAIQSAAADESYSLVQRGITDASRLFFELRISDGTTIATARTDPSTTGFETLVAGKWYHVVGTYDGTTIVIYVFGNLIQSVTPGIGNINVKSSSALSIGKRGSSTSGGWFDGIIGSPMVWNRALSRSEVSILYEVQNAPFVPLDTTLFVATGGIVRSPIPLLLMS